MLLTTELVPGGEEKRRSPPQPSRREQSKTSLASSRAHRPRPSDTTARPRDPKEEEEEERRRRRRKKQQKEMEKRETQVKKEKTGRVEVNVVEKREEKARSTVVDVDSVRETGGGGGGEEEKEEQSWLLETDRQDGLLFYLPWLDVCHKEDIRVKTLPIPSQTVVTRDLARVEVSSVCLFRTENVLLSTASLASPPELLRALVQGALRDVLARHHFHHFLLHRKQVGREVRVAADSVAGRWGIRVERVDM
ncbi:hypothetical protein CRUP_028237 [Coryphaenoides rupestris]|nr:hypothetical protein CRUP_028237 [Coryphaenoides rupestris]